MPTVRQQQTSSKRPLTAERLVAGIVLTYERPGLLQATVASLQASSQLPITVYDDGSTSTEKLAELDFVENSGVEVRREPHRGFIRTWVKIFQDLRERGYNSADGVVLLEDDLLFGTGWDETLLLMAGGVADLGLNPGAMTCFRCHESPQSKVWNLRGVDAYQSMQHGFQLNMVPAFVFGKTAFIEEAASNAENGQHGLDIWFIGGLSHRLGMTSMMTVNSLVAHIGVGKSIAGKQGYQPFHGMGYNLSCDLLREAVLVNSVIQ